MITIEIKDRNGRVLKNGDTIKYANLRVSREDLDFGKYFYSDAYFKWETKIIDPQKEFDKEGFFSLSFLEYYDRDYYCEYFSISRKDFEKEKYQIFERVEDDLGVEVKTEEELIELLQNFEII